MRTVTTRGQAADSSLTALREGVLEHMDLGSDATYYLWTRVSYSMGVFICQMLCGLNSVNLWNLARTSHWLKMSTCSHQDQ